MDQIVEKIETNQEITVAPGSQLPEKKPEDRQRKLLRTAAAFFAVMVALTVLSRAANSLTVPVVSVESPQSTFLTHEISANGTVAPNKETAVVTDAQMLIKEVPIREGQEIKAGDPLLVLDSSDLDEKLTQLNLELKKLQIEIANKDVEKENTVDGVAFSVQKAEENLQRAEEDLERVKEEQEQAVKRAREDLDDSLDRWVNARDDHLSGMLYGERGDEDDEDEDFVNPYETEYRAARRTLQDARNNKDKAILEAERKIEDAKLSIEEEKRKLDEKQGESTVELDIQLKNMEIAKWGRYRAKGGVVTSDVDGIVTEVKVTPGQRTTGETIATIAEGTSGYRFETELDEDQMKYVSRGDEAEILFSGSTIPVKVTIDSLNPKTDDNGKTSAKIVAELPPETGALGLAGVLSVTRKTQNYETCIPISALREESAGKYVLAVEERESVMGIEQVAVKIPVKVLDKTSVRAAVEGALGRDTKLITGSEKQIAEGDRVRLGV